MLVFTNNFFLEMSLKSAYRDYGHRDEHADFLSLYVECIIVP